MKVIIWGYRSTNTYAYVHWGWYKAFKHLGHDVHWFDDNNLPPDDFDLKDALADSKIPIRKDGIYVVHVCVNPAKYADCRRLIDLRYNEVLHKDQVYDYTFDRDPSKKIGPCFYFEPSSGGIDRVYISWATDLLPEEINYQDRFHTRLRSIMFMGTLAFGQNQYDNGSNFQGFMKACRENGIEWLHNCPWQNPLTCEQVKQNTMLSYLAPDIRGPEHIKHGYVPCRIFKNISYGQLGLTNSEHVYKELDGMPLYEPDTEKLFYLGRENMHDYDLIRNQMMYIKENHTYINRVQDLMKVIS